MWEYKVIRISSPDSFDSGIVQLGDLGKEGWELVSVVPIRFNESFNATFAAYLKKKLP